MPLHIKFMPMICRSSRSFPFAKKFQKNCEHAKTVTKNFNPPKTILKVVDTIPDFSLAKQDSGGRIQVIYSFLAGSFDLTLALQGTSSFRARPPAMLCSTGGVVVRVKKTLLGVPIRSMKPTIEVSFFFVS